MTMRSSLLCAALLAGLGCASSARAADGAFSNTIAAMPTGNPPAAAAAVRTASAEVFRPAPMPNENVSAPGSKVVASEEASLHPDLLSMHENSSGPLGDTSVEYGRASRVRPAGGMSLSIPMD